MDKSEYKKHLLLCTTPTKQKRKGNEVQKHGNVLKKLKRIENDPSTKNVHILRSKVLFGVCKNGPILLIWPDGIWYEKVSPEKISEILHHILLTVSQ